MRSRTAALAALLVATVFLPVGSSATEPTRQRPVSPSEFRPVEVPDREEKPPKPKTTAPPVTPEPPTPTPEPTPARPSATRKPAPIKPSPTARPARRRVSGVPTYYCRAGVSICTRGYPDSSGADMFAAAGPSLRVGDWRGRVVTVTANGLSIRVKLIDFCACGGGHLIDLYYDAFKALGFPSQATVSW